MLNVNEIILTIQGEGTRAGLPCTLVRLTGCNLRCRWCDSRHAWTEGSDRSLEDVLAEVRRLSCRRVEVTGGEPLLQGPCRDLLGRLCRDGCEVLLETNGSLDISGLDPRVVRIVDVKCPSSGCDASVRWENLPLLTARDEVKFVLADRADYDYARGVLERHGLVGRCPVLFSPLTAGGADLPPDAAERVGGRLQLEPSRLAEWILQDGLDVRLNLQLHKIIWPNRDRGV